MQFIKDFGYRVLNKLSKDPTFFIHVSDLLFPQKNGLTTMQYIVISRMLDTKLLRDGKNPVWHIMLSGKNDIDVEKMNNQYELFLKRMDRVGFNPGVSPFSVVQSPYFGLYDGTHRIGALLSEKSNLWLPIVIRSKYNKQFFPQNGKQFFTKQGLSIEKLTKLEQEHKNLWKKIRHSFIAVFGETDFYTKKNQLLNIIEDVGEIENIKLSTSTKYGKFCLVSYSLNFQDYYIRKNKLQSHIIDDLRKSIGNILPSFEKWRLPGSVTESILLEEKVLPNKANI